MFCFVLFSTPYTTFCSSSPKGVPSFARGCIVPPLLIAVCVQSFILEWCVHLYLVEDAFFLLCLGALWFESFSCMKRRLRKSTYDNWIWDSIHQIITSSTAISKTVACFLWRFRAHDTRSAKLIEPSHVLLRGHYLNKKLQFRDSKGTDTSSAIDLSIWQMFCKTNRVLTCSSATAFIDTWYVGLSPTALLSKQCRREGHPTGFLAPASCSSRSSRLS